MALPHDHRTCAEELHTTFHETWTNALPHHKVWVANNLPRDYICYFTSNVHEIYSELDKAVSRAEVDGDIAWYNYSSDDVHIQNMVRDRQRRSVLHGHVYRLQVIWVKRDEKYALQMTLHSVAEGYDDHFKTLCTVKFFKRKRMYSDVSFDSHNWKPIGLVTSAITSDEHVNAMKRRFFSLDDTMWDKFKQECFAVPRHSDTMPREFNVLFIADDETQARAMRRYAISRLGELYELGGKTGKLFGDKKCQNRFYFSDDIRSYFVMVYARISGVHSRRLKMNFRVHYDNISMLDADIWPLNQDEIQQTMAITDDEIAHTFNRNAFTGAVCMCCALPIKNMWYLK